MRKTMKKMLAASTVCIIMSGSFIGGSARILAEQYYGWNDTTRHDSPFFLYVTPTNESQRKTENSNVVYCFNRDKEWPANWDAVRTLEQVNNDKPYNLPIYDKLPGTTESFTKNASKPRVSGDIGKALIAVLKNGYPNKNLSGLDDTKSRILTQLAIWYFSDSYNKDYFKQNYELTDQENNSLMELIKVGEEAAQKQEKPEYHLDIYITTEKNYQHKPYQNLLGSTLIPKLDPKPKPEPEPGPKPNPEPGPKPKPMPQPKPEPEPEPQPEPMPKPEPQPEAKPQKPTKPSNATSQSSGKSLPKTNDTGSLITVLGTGLLSLLGLGFLTRRKRKD
ncbi:fibronectin-binding protein Fnz [Streptococcus equi subsp. zooepidemicus Sz105]|uniref:thioester-forming surface-anchored protein n=1 Tax=Streptococcus equi TaxID=1336 RepID=UPI0005B82F0E|nr:thioester-forming surface-anchored protein [Streptococcus equi]KIS14322.1 fibronectin-binding protein Fnz [Streptococcus equi subsp. zooepidemicus Sz105]MDI5988677.1 thioester-forming surface-anchored protein [Streptococcus equi subsp. zooepidemicus]HEL0585197.1 thioester-forming surface-anchored protein [Streptococcus equi subsp. zooepidemicus]HEL0608039.1 thioester-forming surface-anchored protein [Streptococcus equi subsp. zooepidemicus]HEL1232208.1 thioester-forming surface-anchored pro